MSKQVLTAQDIAEICGISESKAYQTIRLLNDELEQKGYLTFRGRVSSAYFYEKMYGMKATRGRMQNWAIRRVQNWIHRMRATRERI